MLLRRLRTYVRSVCECNHTRRDLAHKPSPAAARSAMYRWRPMERRRIDTLLAERGLAGSRTSAAESVRAGRVRIGRDGPRASKPGQLVSDDVELLVDGERRYVSRGGIKLENALDALGIDVDGRACLDVGASTGGFTDCLLQRGAARVIAVDVGYGQLDWTPARRPARDGARAHSTPAHLEPRTSFRSRPILRRSTSPSSRWPRSCPPSRRAWRRAARSWRWSSPSSSSGASGSGAAWSATPEDRREALLAVANAARDAGLADRAASRPPGCPGRRATCETFIWCAGGGGIDDLEAAVAKVEA